MTGDVDDLKARLRGIETTLLHMDRLLSGPPSIEARNVELLTDGEQLLPFGNNESTWDLTV